MSVIMKKIILLISISIVSLFVFTGCSKEKEEFSLVGTTWAAYHYHYNGIPPFDSYDVYRVWRFISDTEIEETSRTNGPTGGLIGKPVVGTYLLKYPKLTVTITETTLLDEVEINVYECEFIDKQTFRTVYWKDDLIEFNLQ